MENELEEVNSRWMIDSKTNEDILFELQHFFHQKNQLIHTFKTTLEKMKTDEYQIKIRADRTPSNEHQGRFNNKSNQDFAIVMIGDKCEKRDIIIQRRDSSLKRVSETHRLYDALQYPIIYWNGQDGYNFNLLEQNSHKKVN